MEILSKILKKVEDSGLIRGFQASRSGVPGLSISHILFADDTMIMCDADPVQLMYLRLAMTCFEASTGLRVNLGKSEIVPVGDVVNLRVLADILCLSHRLPPYELSRHAFGFYIQIHFDLESYHREDGTSVGWLEETISFYSIAKRIEQIQRKFLWGGSDDTFKHCFGENGILYCSPVSKGGLGVRKLVPFNRALLDKWLWRFGVEDNRLWKRVLVERHGAGCGDWSTGWTRDSHGCGLWKGIMLGWNAFSAHESFPALYACASNKSATINLIMLLHSWVCFKLIVLHGWWMDGLWWSLKNSGIFDVRSRYSSFRESPPSIFPWKSGAVCVVAMVETVEHLLLHCHVAGALWNWIFQAFGIFLGYVWDRWLSCCHSWWNGLGRHSSDIWNFATSLLDVDDLEGAQSTNF
uniref:Reverse transcriptase domain-containing protein n=1 Tax=Fagus sylvatica TaxID=28930 RepID=A0A2N9J7Y5_FAGSY